jgi:hypothetical protein
MQREAKAYAVDSLRYAMRSAIEKKVFTMEKERG